MQDRTRKTGRSSLTGTHAHARTCENPSETHSTHIHALETLFPSSARPPHTPLPLSPLPKEPSRERSYRADHLLERPTGTRRLARVAAATLTAPLSLPKTSSTRRSAFAHAPPFPVWVSQDIVLEERKEGGNPRIGTVIRRPAAHGGEIVPDLLSPLLPESSQRERGRSKCHRLSKQTHPSSPTLHGGTTCIVRGFGFGRGKRGGVSAGSHEQRQPPAEKKRKERKKRSPSGFIGWTAGDILSHLTEI